jgi:hypothetical protein
MASICSLRLLLVSTKAIEEAQTIPSQNLSQQFAPPKPAVQLSKFHCCEHSMKNVLMVGKTDIVMIYLIDRKIFSSIHKVAAVMQL